MHQTFRLIGWEKPSPTVPFRKYTMHCMGKITPIPWHPAPIPNPDPDLNPDPNTDPNATPKPNALVNTQPCQ